MSNLNDKMENGQNSDSTLFSEPTAKENNTSKRRTGSMKKQLRSIIIMAVLVALSLCLYFFVVLPIVNRSDDEPKETIELLEGEVLGRNDSLMIFDHYERSEIAEILVHNQYGEFAFYYDTKEEEFFVKDHPAAPYDKDLFSSLVVSTGYTIVQERISKDCENLAEYGLAEEQNPAYYTLTTRDGISETVYVGDVTPSGSGHYVRHADRNAVYVLDSSIGNTVLMPLENMITPTLTIPASTNDYFTIENFVLLENDEAKIAITYLDPKAQEAAAMQSTYKMIHPGNYSVSATAYTNVLDALVKMTGISTLVYAPDITDLEEYGLSEPAYYLHFEYKGIEQEIAFSQKNENGNYYAYTLLFDLITEIDGDSLFWFDYDLMNWVDPPIFMMNINEIKTISLSSATAKRVFDLEGEKENLIVTERETGFKPEVYNFRQFYKTLLTIHIRDTVSVDLTKDELQEYVKEENLYLTLNIETRAGQFMEYKFYPYSTRRAYYTVDGNGEFYVLRDNVTKVISDCEKVMTNTPVDATEHS